MREFWDRGRASPGVRAVFSCKRVGVLLRARRSAAVHSDAGERGGSQVGEDTGEPHPPPISRDAQFRPSGKVNESRI